MKFSTSFSLGLVATTFFAVLQPATAQITYLDNCNTATVEADKCCFWGETPCIDTDWNFTVSKGSCNGAHVCGATGMRGGAIIGENSCNAVTESERTSYEDLTCQWAGSSGGSFEVGDDSCHGSKSCTQAGALANSIAVIGNGSCRGDAYACNNLARGGSGYVGDGSCLGHGSCNAAGRSGGSIKVGTNSCHGEYSCNDFANHADGIIGDNSCRGHWTCIEIGFSAPLYTGRKVQVGSNSCNCDNCCSCLKDLTTVNVPHDSCNQLETDPQDPQCCKADGTKGSLSLPDDVIVIPTLPGGSSGGAVATTSISVAPSMSPSHVPSASMSPSTPTFNLEDYTLPDPVCALTSDDNVQCNFTNVVPTAGNLEYSITGFDTCNGTNPDTSAISLPSEVTRAIAINGTDSVTIDLTTNFVLVNGASKAYTFCLLTTLNDDSGNVMIYQGQKINTTFVADGDFTVSSITSEKYEGINDETNTNTKTFGVTATRCDINRNPVSNTSPLAIGATLFICIDSIDVDKAVIKSVDTFGAKKGNGAFTNLLSGNTDAQGVGTSAVIIGTRPFASFFADTTPLDISGTVTLEVTENNDAVRRLSARILQSGETDEFELQVELEAVEESSARPSTAFGVAGSALIAGAIAAVAAM